MKTVAEVPRHSNNGSIFEGYVRRDAPAFTFDEVLAEAKNAAHKLCSDHDRQRKWVTAELPDSYGHKDYHAQFWVLEGSPPKAFIVMTPAFIRMLDWRGFLRATWCEFEEGWWVLTKKKPDYVARIVA